MKKLFFILIAALALTAFIGTVNGANKSVRQAAKMASDFSKGDVARSKINEVLVDSTVARDAEMYYVAGKIEETAFRHYYKLLAINRNDPNVDRVAMADALLKARYYYELAMMLDSVKDKKGRVSTEYSGHIADFLNAVVPSYYNAGIAYMNKRKYFPGAYDAFMAYADAPDRSYYRIIGSAPTDSMRANALFYAGVMAYNDEKYEPAYTAFERARLLGHPKKEVLLNQMNCLSQLIKADSTLTDSLTHKITGVAAEGYRRFALTEPAFIKKYIAGLMTEQLTDSAINVVSAALQQNNESGLLHSIMGGLLLAKGNVTESAAEYRLAAEQPDAEFTTLQMAAKTLAREGLELLSIEIGRAHV